ncbi:MAG: hypothetical protein E6R03_00955 [Hyphomicrobiaceae bacterium]|nr:MAG: hypothetical protein E6R03_00955 [Hyphomicrobiaceae bacterium]
MTTYSTISNAAVAVGAIPSSTTMTAMRDNPIAIAEGASGAPISVYGWHPVDKVTVGDGKDGLIYSSAVSGSVASVVTSDFADGWEYRIVTTDLSCDAGGVNVRLTLDGYFATSAAYGRLISSGQDFANITRFGLDVELRTPRLTKKAHMVVPNTWAGNTIYAGGQQDAGSFNSTAQKLLKARISFTSGNISDGKIYLLRRREFITSP